jgi:hypothetical protein
VVQGTHYEHELTGIFQQVKRVGRYTFYNQIDANRISSVK